MSPGYHENRFLQKQFSHYYNKEEVLLPPRFGTREFGFIFYGGRGMLRHQGFSTKGELKKFLVMKGPAHVYYSTTYYKKPDAPTMNEKGWMGADLIFDLDADHLEGADQMTYAEQLEAVKEELFRLIDDFLVMDFGYAYEDMHLLFSGGRGYHVHIRDPRVLGLGSHERREIVDYITGVGVDEKMHFPKEVFATKGRGSYLRTKERTVMPSIDAPGWSGRLARGLVAFVKELEEMDREEALHLFTSEKGIGKDTGAKIYASLFRGEKGKRGADRIINNQTVEIFPSDKIKNAFLNAVISRVKVQVQGEADEPVTTDIRRIIRLGGSLHGKTGFRVTEIKPSKLSNFDPLVHAVPDIFKKEEMTVVAEKPAVIELMGQTYEIKGRERVSMPVGIFAIARNLAKLEEK